MPGKMEIIALEEHYLDPELKRHFSGLDETRQPEVVARLDDVGALRLKEMDEAGIDIQVLSHASRAGSTIGSPRRCAPIPIASPPLPRCRPPTPGPPPTSSNARSRSSAS